MVLKKSNFKSSAQDLKKRGYLNSRRENSFKTLHTADLIHELKSSVPEVRTTSAKILGDRQEESAVIHLCHALTKEKALYSKIAISEALGKIGRQAVPHLIVLLGVIGKNQYKTLPKKEFLKKNYPLPRDIAARTLIKVGVLALPALEIVLHQGTRGKMTEAIDAIGYIAFYTDEHRSLPYLLKCLKQHCHDELILWKIIRALSAYPFEKVNSILNEIKLRIQNPILLNEIERSLQQVNKKNLIQK